MDEWHMKPFNGQVKRQLNISLITNKFKPDIVIETGTYFGTTTTYLAGLAATTYTFEINDEFASVSKKRFENSYPNLNIQIINGDSVVELPNILKTIKSNEKIFAYLDAHWLDSIPTSEEIKILNNWGNNWIAVIDDFRINHDTGYGFDSYNNLEVGLKIIPEIIGLQVYIPKEKSNFETGARRGTGYVFTSHSIGFMTAEILQNLVRVK